MSTVFHLSYLLDKCWTVDFICGRTIGENFTIDSLCGSDELPVSPVLSFKDF